MCSSELYMERLESLVDQSRPRVVADTATTRSDVVKRTVDRTASRRRVGVPVAIAARLIRRRHWRYLTSIVPFTTLAHFGTRV